jgi:hypothetical protein
MEDKNTIQSYINDFRRHFAAFLKPGIGLACKVFPAKGEGAILEFALGTGIKNDDEYMPVKDTVNESLKGIQQRMFGGNLDAIRFAGTNIAMEPDRIILIKGENTASEWSNAGAKNDVQRIVAPVTKR